MIFSISTIAISQEQHQCIDKYTTRPPEKNRRICRELKQISLLNSEGSPLLHPVALLIINVQCENNMNSKHVVANDLILSKSIYFHRIR